MKLRFFTHCGAALPAVACTMKLRFFTHGRAAVPAVNGPPTFIMAVHFCIFFVWLPCLFDYLFFSYLFFSSLIILLFYVSIFVVLLFSFFFRQSKNKNNQCKTNFETNICCINWKIKWLVY